MDAKELTVLLKAVQTYKIFKQKNYFYMYIFKLK